MYVYSSCSYDASDDLLLQLKSIFDSFVGLNKTSPEDSSFSRGIDHVFAMPLGQFLEPYFVILGRSVRSHVATARTIWIDLATKDGTMNRFFAVVFGYLIVAFLVALYLNVLNVGNVRNAGRAIRNAIRQQLIVLKVYTLLFILFDLELKSTSGCGIYYH